MVEVGRLKDAHPPPISTRRAITMARSVSRCRAPPMCLVTVSAVSDGTPVGHISSMLPSRGDGGGPPGLAEADCKDERPRTRRQAFQMRAPTSKGADDIIGSQAAPLALTIPVSRTPPPQGEAKPHFLILKIHDVSTHQRARPGLPSRRPGRALRAWSHRACTTIAWN